jgi:para-aminobenzoate synthetase component 1
MRKFVKYEIAGVSSIKENLLHYAKNFPRCCVLISNAWRNNSDCRFLSEEILSDWKGVNSDRSEMIVAVGSIDEIIPAENSFETLNRFQKEKNDWLFGFFSYDLKNEVETLSSENFDGIGLPQMHFFQPKYIFRFTPAITKGAEVVQIGFLTELSTEEEVATVFREICSATLHSSSSFCLLPSAIKRRISKEEYLSTVGRIKHHIHLGDIYEMNYCMEFFSEESEINPAEVFLKLNEASQTPFSAFYRMDDKYLLCASPERFLKKEGRKIISQPIKGTSGRGATIPEDTEIKKMLSRNEKERSENVMIVDLVRNDLSKSCDNVRVDELFGVYTFKKWHQMISTVSGEMRHDVRFTDVIKNSFPMGSMTGAPKMRAMELIEQYEKTKRGLYSGAVGYITPSSSPSGEGSESEEADFDFNVVIRSILYNATSNYLSFQVGSAITANSAAENEYQECVLKAKGMFEALNINTNGDLQMTNDELNSLAHA